MSSGATDHAIGMMDGAYFTSRKDILDFFNNLLNMNLAKIEQTASGAVACQLMDYIFPGTVPMKKINWEAKLDFQYIENYKVLQASFMKNNIQKHVDVDRLIRAKYQDNLEFCQWLKAFYEQAAPSFRTEYDPVQRRSMGKGGKNLDAIFLPRTGKNKPPAKLLASNTTKSAASGRKSTAVKSRQVRSSDNSTGGPGSKTNLNPNRSTNANRTSKPRTTRNNDEILADADLMKKNLDLKKTNAELELTLSGVEHERDFYFDKLRGIEVMLQVHEEKGVEESDPIELIGRIFKVLYAKLEDNVVVNDDGELTEDPLQEENVPPENVDALSDNDMLDDSLLTMED